MPFENKVAIDVFVKIRNANALLVRSPDSAVVNNPALDKSLRFRVKDARRQVLSRGSDVVSLLNFVSAGKHLRVVLIEMLKFNHVGAIFDCGNNEFRSDLELE